MRGHVALVGLVLCFRSIAVETFVNPVADKGADPWVVQWEGGYLYCRSAKGGVCVDRAERLHELGKAKSVRVWAPPPHTPYSKELWAPELHRLDGKWYIYVAADDGKNEHHRMYVLEGKTPDPQGAYTFKGKIAAPTDRWAIDGTVLVTDDGRKFLVWSGWEGTENVKQDLYIAPLSNPWTIGGERVRISTPEHDWEKRGGRPWINEGPAALRHNGKTFIVYSASGSWCDDYCLGVLLLSGNDPMKPGAWTKAKEPAFARTADVFGPGHCSFVTSPDGKEDWIVYHTARRSGSGWDRQVRIQRFGWRADGWPDFGKPVSSGVALPMPSGTR
jgi:GH43 family beta-xylosidase